jgi:hypothetical protein
MKRFEKKRDNRGSTIIVVLVTMTFLTVLASVLLYLSTVNLQMKKLDKAGKVNFYGAEAIMNELRAGVQEAVSDAIKEAYTEVLDNYKSNLSEDEQRQQLREFRDLFFNEVSKALFSPSGTEYIYQTDVLKALVSKPQTDFEISGSQVVRELDADSRIISFILKDVTVRYTAKSYETTISSDIRIDAPVLPYTVITSIQTAIPDFAIVAKGSLWQPPGHGTVSISGNVYARDLTVGGNYDVFNVQNAAYFVLDGPVTVDGGTLSFNALSSLWATDIKLYLNGSIGIGGDAYISNDLNLYGSETSAVLSGRYFGYGNNPDEPNNNSAIIINGKNTVLDMSALRALMLAGHSYVNFGTTDGYVMMGESVSVKSNQLAYLVPDSCLTGGITNPYQFGEGEDPGNEFLQDRVLLNQKIMNNKTLSDYGIKDAATDIKYIRKQVGSTYAIYICLNFTDSKEANNYFKDYYNANAPEVLKYLDIYSNGISLWSNATKNLAGGAFTFDGTTLGAVIDATYAPTETIKEISLNYNNLCTTLSRTLAGSADTAYDYFVNAPELAALPPQTVTYYPEEGTPKVAVINGDYDIVPGVDSSVHVVIARGNVTVSGNYTGLILAGGNVTLYRDAVVTADRPAVADALQALTVYDAALDTSHYMYLNPQYISPMNVKSTSDGMSAIWDVNTLVTYSNWKKNEL